MQRSLAISSSGLRHADTRQWATAHNSANLTAATTVVRTTAVEQPVGGGVWKGVEGRFEQRFQLGAIDAPMGRSVDAVGLAVEQIATVHHAGAVVNVVRTSDEMLGSLIDILG